MMSNAPPNNQGTIATHAVLAGLTPLIPVPVVDDIAKNYFRRRMVRGLAPRTGALSTRIWSARSEPESAGRLGAGVLTRSRRSSKTSRHRMEEAVDSRAAISLRDW